MNIFKINRVMNFILLFVFLYSIFVIINQQSKLHSYSKDISYYSTQIQELKEKKEDLIATQENVNSEEYIEKIAREKLDMYLPNETVYIDANK